MTVPVPVIASPAPQGKRDASRRPAVCILLRGSAVYAEVIELTRAMLTDGRFEPVVVTASGVQAAAVRRATDDRARILRLDGTPHSKASTPHGSDNPAQGFRTKLLHRGKQILLNVPAMRMPILWRGLRADLAAASRLLKRVRPVALATFSDRTPRPEMAFLHAARQAGVATVLLPFAVSTQESDAFLRRNDRHLRLDRGLLAPARRAFACRHPGHALDTVHGPMLFYPLWECLALAAHGLQRTSPWIVGGGEVDRIAVISEEDRDATLALGIPGARIRVTGQPSLDPLHAARNRRDAIERTLRSTYDLPAERPIVVCAVPHYAEHGQRGWQEHDADTEALFGALGGCGGATLLSLHPKSKAETYRDAAARHALKIATEPLRDILPAADIFVAGFSSTVRWAALLGIPTVVADLPRIGYTMYDGLRSIPKLTDTESLAQALAAYAGDAARRATVGKQLQAEAGRAGIIDGKACARTIDLIAEAAGMTDQSASRIAAQ